ncbi:hypothetical protein VB713_22690 [Anabaena cylindrica UHCC 0172]|uniref:hypothetical protein n=1 Tax=Anabaena cylindrica TaxID=1165 RepID=UPI002B1E9A17|nr:hypothetical protein [Anabaena cylindrica]MEA5553750.1 hypothetical protein [Anabaena cylindrica UHCC 0172]
MTEVKTATSKSRSYQDYLISSLQNEEHSTAYLETFLELEEEGREPELLRAGLKPVPQNSSKKWNR